MLVLEAKIKGKIEQFEALDEAMRTAQFIRNSCLRFWMDNPKVSRNDLYKYCKTLADDPAFPWANKLNSQARQAHAERAWSAIARFYDNCKKQVPGKKGYPKFKKFQTRASVEYNAAINILKKGLNTVGHTGIKAWGENDLYLSQAIGSDKLTR